MHARMCSVPLRMQHSTLPCNIIMSLCLLCSTSDPRLPHPLHASLHNIQELSNFLCQTKENTYPTTCKTRQNTRLYIAQLSGLKPAMLASSVQSVVACYATVPRVCTLVLFIVLFSTLAESSKRGEETSKLKN